MNARAITTALATVAASWYAMMIVHEAGHALAAISTHARVERIVLPWFGLSRTDHNGTSHPTFIVAAGPIFGSLVPLLLFAALRLLSRTSAAVPLARLFAGFCLIANGGYMCSAAFRAIGDAGDLVDLGCPAPLLYLPGAIAAIVGLLLWHGLGPQFGLGKEPNAPSRSLRNAAIVMLVMTLLIVAAINLTMPPSTR